MTTEPKLKKTVAKEFLLAAIDREISDVKRGIAEFAERVLADAHNALGWGNEAFQKAARVRVLTLLRGAVLHSTEAEVPKQCLIDIATREALSGARNPERSTSATSRLMTECVTEVWGDMADGWLMHFFSDALRADPEYIRQLADRQAWLVQQNVMQAEAQAAAKKEARRLARKEKKAGHDQATLAYAAELGDLV